MYFIQNSELISHTIKSISENTEHQGDTVFGDHAVSYAQVKYISAISSVIKHISVIVHS